MLLKIYSLEAFYSRKFVNQSATTVDSSNAADAFLLMQNNTFRIESLSRRKLIDLSGGSEVCLRSY